jgi:hypothetical protein
MTLTAIGSAVSYTLFLWWFSTGAILWLDRLPRATYRFSLIGASVIALGGVFGLIASMGDATPKGALIAFTCALAVWGWHELSFLTGLITGPRSLACPPGAAGWRRFKLAASTLIYHEVALALTAVAMAAITWGHPNQVGTWTFLVLFACRLRPRPPALSDQLPEKRADERALPAVRRCRVRSGRRAGVAGVQPGRRSVRGHSVFPGVRPHRPGGDRARLHGPAPAGRRFVALGLARLREGQSPIAVGFVDAAALLWGVLIKPL